MSLAVGRNTISFAERQGLKFLQDFWAVDKRQRPVRISHNDIFTKETSLIASDAQGKELGAYELQFFPNERTMKAPLLQVEEGQQGRHIGQLLTLSGLLEFWGNRWNNFKLFSLKDTMGFHAKMGFVLDSDNPDYILHGLKSVIKSKASYIDDIKNSANIYYQRVKNYPKSKEENPFVLDFACKVITEYMSYIMRTGQKKHLPRFLFGSNFKFTDWEFLTQRNYLNKLLKDHNIDFRFINHENR